MRDGVKLNATLYRPKNGLPVPIICTLTPYIADSTTHAEFILPRTDMFSLRWIRGRGNSEGVFEPFSNEARDGHDIVEWLAAQPWCSGQVAMWGGSYGGADQWLTLREAPAHLATIVPVASVHAGVDYPSIGNILMSFEMQWLTYISGVARNSSIIDDFSFWIEKYEEMYQNHRPYKELDEIVGNHSTYFQNEIKHPHPDEFWDCMTLSEADYNQISVPILSITGNYDDDQLGAMEYYHRHISSKSTAREAHYLVIGPWDHSGT